MSLTLTDARAVATKKVELRLVSQGKQARKYSLPDLATRSLW
jgi:hypothetical protein